MLTQWVRPYCQFLVAFGLFSSLMLSPVANAQEPARPNGAPVDVSDYEADDDGNSNDPNKPQALKNDPNKPQALKIGGPTGGHKSKMLGATLILQYMQITQRGRRVTFWGARIVSLDKNSPLLSIGLELGDVITRLDGTSVANKASRKSKKQPYRLPETDEHYGQTTVRFIFHSTQNVQQKTVNLGNLRNRSRPQNGPVPLAP